SGYERKLMKRIKEKEINRSERADGAAGNKQETSVERILVPVDLAGEPNGSEGDNRGQEDHDQTQAVEPGGETQMPLGRDGERSNMLKVALIPSERCEKRHCCSKGQDGSNQRSLARGRSGHDQNGGDDWTKNDEQDH